MYLLKILFMFSLHLYTWSLNAAQAPKPFSQKLDLKRFERFSFDEEHPNVSLESPKTRLKRFYTKIFKRIKEKNLMHEGTLYPMPTPAIDHSSFSLCLDNDIKTMLDLSLNLTDDCNNPKITNELLITIFQTRANLESVFLIDCIQITQDALEILITTCKNLKNLMIFGKSLINPEYLLKLQESHDELIVIRE